MPTKKRPFQLTQEYKDLQRKQVQRRFKFFVTLARNLAAEYTKLHARVWVPPAKGSEPANFARMYVGGGGGYLTITAADGLASTERGKVTFIKHSHLYPSQTREWDALVKAYTEALKDAVVTWGEVESEETVALATKMGYEI